MSASARPRAASEGRAAAVDESGALPLLDATAPPPRTGSMGGKAWALHRLARAGHPVPRFVCLGVEAYARVSAELGADLTRELAGLEDAAPEALEAAAARIRRLFLDAALPEPVRRLLEVELPAALDGQGRYAVRSSAVGEDGSEASFAGQLDSFLCTPASEVPAAVRRCWASAFTPRLLHYQRARGLPPEETRVAVVVQEMVDSEASGVLFTVDPTGRSDGSVVVAGLGLGEGVVTDRVETDSYTVPGASGAIRSQVADKRSRVAFDSASGSGTVVEPVPDALRSVPVLTPDAVGSLVGLGERIAHLFGEPQDIEWALDRAGRFQILQSRPITSLPRGEVSVFDNSNIVESYPGVTSPLTFSFVRGLYENIFRGALRRMGVRPRALDLHAHVFRNMVGLLEGRVYYVLSNWYRMLQQLPGSTMLVPAWQEAVGLRERFREAEVPAGRRGWSDASGRAAIVSRVFVEWLGLDRSIGALREKFDRNQAEFRSRDLSRLDDHELCRVCEQATANLLDGWEITILNDFFAIGFSSAARRLLQGISGGGPDLLNDLLCGEPGMASVEPVRSIVRLAEQVRGNDELRARIEALVAATSPVRDGLDELEQEGHFAAFSSALREHLERFGERCFEELKLESESFRSDPRPLLRIVLGYAQGGISGDLMLERERAIRGAAERSLAQALAGRPLKRGLVRFVLSQARRSIKHRESSRLDRAKAFDIPRAVFRQLGQNLARQGVLSRPRDVFFLTAEELFAYVRGASVDPQLDSLVERRRALDARHRERRPAERVVTHGTVYRNPIPQRLPAAGAAEGGAVLEGLGCAPGVVTGEAMVVRNPADAGDVRGKVLVAEMTDPGWVFLMISAAGLVAEKGSVLSHTAIIGRELGIVTLVGVEGATERIPDGARVRLDGNAGTVQVLAPADGAGEEA